MLSEGSGGSFHERITAVMITRNRRAEACRAVDRLLSLEERPGIIVIDNASSDGTADAIDAVRAPAVSVVRLACNAGAAGRNVGVKAAATPYVAFVDDDSAWTPGGLARAVEIMDRYPRLAVLAARVLVGDHEVTDPACAQMAASPLAGAADLPGRPVLGFVACGAVVRRDAFLASGGFDERYGVGGEEGPLAVELAMRGWGLAYVEEVTARHWPSPSRDPSARRRTVTRNALWLSWSRRRWPTVLRATARAVRLAVDDPAVRAGLLDATRRSYHVLRQRRSVELWLERELRLID